MSTDKGHTAIHHWCQVLHRDYGHDASLRRLDGEYDENFQVLVNNVPTAILKVMRPGCTESFVELQVSMLRHVRAHSTVPVPDVIPTVSGAYYQRVVDHNGEARLIWLLTWLPGTLYAHTLPQSLSLIQSVGEQVGQLAVALAAFDHPTLARDLKWDLIQAAWIHDELAAVTDPDKRALIEHELTHWQHQVLPALRQRPVTTLHNDLNDYNLLVHSDIALSPSATGDATGHVAGDAAGHTTAKVTGVFDFGDTTRGPLVCELAIAGAYLILGQAKPLEALAALVKGVHAYHPLTEADIDLLWPCLKMRLCVSAVNAAIMKRQKPDDPYVTISEQPVWSCLSRIHDIHAAEAALYCRVACGLPAVNGSDSVMNWLSANRDHFKPVIALAFAQAPILDLSAQGSEIPRDPFTMDIAAFDQWVEAQTAGEPAIGRYAEPRLIYTHRDFRDQAHRASRRRTLHLGVDLFAPAQTPVCSPIDAVVHAVDYRASPLDYGGVVVLEHQTPQGQLFYTLYGHLAKSSALALTPGAQLKAGETFALLGERHENGGWPPHLHLQLALHTFGKGCDIDGVADPDLREVKLQWCPDPSVLLGLEHYTVEGRRVQTERVPQAQSLSRRAARFPRNLKLSYRQPVAVARGYRHFLFDTDGRPYLDAYNNVPHVGHAHPALVEVTSRQMTRVNTNTRYLQTVQLDYADALVSRLPEPLSVCLFTASGSEANEVALRLARAATGAKDLLVMATGYHGHTTTTIDISHYKFAGSGGMGQPDWVHVLDVPDRYRGKYRDDAAGHGAPYVSDVKTAIKNLQDTGRPLCGFIAETWPSVGGQIQLPRDYLAGVYDAVRAAGGVCIADEVQTGLGRLGHDFWGFESQQVVPDIVVLGKPLGNGYPMGAVITTPAIAEQFVTGMEFFSTFGGSTLACATGLEVLNIIDREALPDNAAHTGDVLLQQLNTLMERHEIIGDVRGRGLFIGVELVRHRDTREPATAAAAYVAERLRQLQILIGTDGPFDNVLKIRPPLTFGCDDAEQLTTTLDRVLQETAVLHTLTNH